MIDDYLYFNWETPPKELNFEASTKEIADKIEEALTSLESCDAYKQLFIYAPMLLSSIIEYQIDVSEEGNRKEFNAEYIIKSVRLLKDALSCKLSDAMRELKQLQTLLPKDIWQRKQKSDVGRCIWQSTNPKLLRRLADVIAKEYAPCSIVSTAHNAIRHATLLSLYLNTELYFVCFSSKSFGPLITKFDAANIEEVCTDKKVLCFQEEVLYGRKLKELKASIEKYAAETRTASALCFIGATTKPDYVGKYFY